LLIGLDSASGGENGADQGHAQQEARGHQFHAYTHVRNLLTLLIHYL
jgi:hypothetical protein